MKKSKDLYISDVSEEDGAKYGDAEVLVANKDKPNEIKEEKKYQKAEYYKEDNKVVKKLKE